MKKLLSGPFIYIIIVVGIILLSGMVGTFGTTVAEEVSYNEFLEMVKNDQVAAVTSVDKNVYILKKGSEIPEEEFHTRSDFYTYTDDISEMKKDLIRIYHPDKDVETLTVMDIPVKVNSYPKPEDPWYMLFLPYLIIVGVMAIFWYFIMKQQGGGGKVMQFGKSRAKMSNGEINGKRVASVKENLFADYFMMNELHYRGALQDWCAIHFPSRDSNPLTNEAKLFINETLVTELYIDGFNIGDFAFHDYLHLTKLTVGEGEGARASTRLSILFTIIL